MCHPKARCCFLGSGLRQLPSVFWSSLDTCPKIRSIGFRSCCFWRSDGPDRQVQRLGALYPRGAVADCRGRLPGLALGISASTEVGGIGREGLRGTSPALAGNVGTGGAFALSRDGDQDVDVPTLAPDRSRCRLVVSNEGRGQSHLFTQKGTLFTILMSLLGLRGTGPALAAASWRRRKALGR